MSALSSGIEPAGTGDEVYRARLDWRTSSRALITAAATTVAAFIIGVPAASAQGLLTQGTPFIVNSYTLGSQSVPSVAAGAGGDFVVAWESYRSTGTPQDGSGRGVFARTFDAFGTPTSAEFRVNAETSGDQKSADVAARDGATALEYVVVWNSAAQDGDADGVFMQTYQGSAPRLGADFQVNTFTTGVQNEPAAFWLPDGGALTAGACSRQVRPPATDGDIHCRADVAPFPALTTGGGGGTRRYGTSRSRAGVEARHGSHRSARAENESGSVPGGLGVRGILAGAGEFRVNAYTTGDQARPDACPLGNGEFVVVWTSVGQDGTTSSVFARRGDNVAGTVGEEFPVNAFTSGTQDFARVCCHGDGGGFVVVWQGNGTGPSSDGNLSGVFARRFDSMAQPLEDDFLVNVFTTGQQTQPSVGCDAAGDFVVAWTDLSSSNAGVIARAFGADGMPLGEERRLVTSAGGLARNPDVAVADNGRVVVAWNKSFSDGNGDGIQAQRARIAGIGTTTTSSTTSTLVTTTTLATAAACGDPVGSAGLVAAEHYDPEAPAARVITAVDALFVLRASIGAAQCAPCVCDVNDSGSITATDALFVLRAAVGQPAPLTGPPCV